MKITKILLVALALTLFSCSQEEPIVVSETSSIYVKDKELKETEVTELRNECITISTSSEFLEMRERANEFVAALNNSSADLTSRDNLEKWLDNNLSTTYFETTKDGLDMLDDLASKAKNFLETNQTFFESLSNATKVQVNIILEPIFIPGEFVAITSSCSENCNNDFQNQLEFEDFAYSNTVEAINNSFLLPDGKKLAYGLAEAAYVSGVKAAISTYDTCLDSCD